VRAPGDGLPIENKETTVTEKQKRESQTEIVVQSTNPDDGGVVWQDIGYNFNTVQAAEKWIAQEGVEAHIYRVARVWPAVKVEVEQTPRRVVKPA
jgi:hypothetical protein